MTLKLFSDICFCVSSSFLLNNLWRKQHIKEPFLTPLCSLYLQASLLHLQLLSHLEKDSYVSF